VVVLVRSKKVSAYISEYEDSLLKLIGDVWEQEHGSFMPLTGTNKRTKAGELKAAIYYAKEYIRITKQLY
jgi:hypothetical protein